MDKDYTRLSNVTLSEFREQLKADRLFNSLSEIQQNAFINQAQEKLNALLNDEGYDDYNFDANSDADLVLAPTSSGLSVLYDDYIQLKFAADTAHDGSNVTGASSNINWSLSSASASDDGSLITYVITLSNSESNVIDGNTDIHCSTPKGADIVKVNGTSFNVIAEYGHTDEFSIYVKNWKES